MDWRPRGQAAVRQYRANPSAFLLLCSRLALSLYPRNLRNESMFASCRAIRAMFAMLLLLCIMIVPHHHHMGGEVCWWLEDCHEEEAGGHEHQGDCDHGDSFLHFSSVQFLRSAQPHWCWADPLWSQPELLWFGNVAALFFFYLYIYYGVRHKLSRCTSPPLPHPHDGRQVSRRGPPAFL